MDQQIRTIEGGPNYKRIYTDILKRKYPDKIKECKHILDKRNLSALDVIALNQKIFGTVVNQKHRSFSQSDIFKILEYQKKHNLNNSQLAMHFNLSRNTVTKWRKMFVS